MISILRGNALALPLADQSVDLIVTSPPYFGLRSYQDGGEHYSGQIGDEPTPAEFVDALIAATAEMVRVLKPSGSIWVNLGDKYARTGGGGGGSSDGGTGRNGTKKRRSQPVSGSLPKSAGMSQSDAGPLEHRSTRPATVANGAPEKSLIAIPERYRIRCIDELGLILRAVVIWSKPNGLPESVTDRVRRSHEDWMHFTKEPRYFSAVDEIREATTGDTRPASGVGKWADAAERPGNHNLGRLNALANPLGKLPGSVWTIPTEPLHVPESLGIDHFAAFPTEWPRRIVQGWSPSGICTECGEGRRPVVASVGLDMGRPQARRAQELADAAGLTEAHLGALLSVGVSDTGRGAATQSGTGKNTAEVYRLAGEARDALGGYAREYLLRRPTSLSEACACPVPTAPTRPAVVLDPFGGTGTTALVAHALGRHGISNDMSSDYCRLAQWRTSDPKQQAKAARREYREPTPQVEGQSPLFDIEMPQKPPPDKFHRTGWQNGPVDRTNYKCSACGKEKQYADATRPCPSCGEAA